MLEHSSPSRAPGPLGSSGGARTYLRSEMLHSVAPATWLTQEAYARLKRELDGLLNARGQQEESSQRLATESRVRQLTALLKNVNI